MYIFYCPEINLKQIISLPEKEMHHAVHVLRLKAGDQMQLIDGKGNIYAAEIIEISKRGCSVKIISTHQQKKENNFNLHIAIAPTKSSNRFDLFLEKVTEIGIDEITPLLCNNSERRKINIEKVEQTLIAAIKQSGRAYLPVLNPLTEFNAFIKDHENNTAQKFIAHCKSGQKQTLAHVLKPNSDVTILIGPEGDFTTDEIDIAMKNKFVPASLGSYRLRTETAGIVTCQTIHTISEIHQHEK
ncbi:MAG: 16S rRNA (uracil(1498)-N(3))-methyltransferase [Fimbriimonadaceae bacterium]|nr:16S rRNA (uracil(1498)-N(3))-methyltransferase [Chitinophagales bacterium]